MAWSKNAANAATKTKDYSPLPLLLPQKNSSNGSDFDNGLRKKAHDFNNILQVLKLLLQQQKITEAAEFLEQVCQEFAAPLKYEKKVSEYRPLNALLEAKKAVAHQQRVQFVVNFDACLKGLTSSMVDVIRIIGNLVDNAIEAAVNQKHKEVGVVIKEEKAAYSFAISNTHTEKIKNEELLFDSDFSTKGDSRGFGLQIVQELIQKNQGQLSLIAKDGVITFTCTFPRKKL